MYYQRKAVYKMKIKHLVPVMPVRNGKVNGQDGVKLAGFYSDNGADAILVFDLSDSDEEHEKNILLLKEMARRVEIPIYAGGHIRRVEDVKKILYAGCQKAVLNYGRSSNVETNTGNENYPENGTRKYCRDRQPYHYNRKNQNKSAAQRKMHTANNREQSGLWRFERYCKARRESSQEELFWMIQI